MSPTGTIEAVWTVGLLRFKGDVVIKTITLKGTTRIRIESTSRQAGLDLGLNARMVRDFFTQVDMHLRM